ncbi:hypothetical protein NUW58_g8013 [Xylaria curta]|uniref:Uncharacterized protein n=1 Tax=Xylaria curta TaxID=42375 RepID=A0ACC1NBP5_9PEZI|nr:hypothetical protein NUW58_g8013 [Xylaria curta]
MDNPKPTASSNSSTTTVEDERARLRRNQRNSRARKQAYVQDLERRWNSCVRLGVQATTEMQKEARRVQEENRLLRALLHQQGFNDVAIQEAVASFWQTQCNDVQSPALWDQRRDSTVMGTNLIVLSPQDNTASNVSQSRVEGASFVDSPAPLDVRADEELNFDDWLTDFCSLQDMFNSANPKDQAPTQQLGSDDGPLLDNDNALYNTVFDLPVYLAFYLSHDIFTGSKPIDYAFIGGLNFSFALLVAPLATLLMLLYGVKTPMFFGVVLLPIGFVSASFATKIWHLYLSQAFCVGTGVGFIYIPATTVIPEWFTKQRSLANGICAAGSGIGGLIVCFAVQGLLETVGLAWSLRITAVVVFFVNLIATLLMRSRSRDINPDLRIFNFHLLASYQVQLLLGWGIIIMFGYISLMFTLPDYALAIGGSSRESGVVAAILNGGAAIGRPFIGYVSDRYGRVEVAGVATFGCSILVFTLWLPITHYILLIAFALLSGSILGIFWASIAPLAADIVGLEQLPALLSMVWLSVVLPSACKTAILKFASS